MQFGLDGPVTSSNWPSRPGSSLFCLTYLCELCSASVWFEIWGSWIRVKRISIFQVNFREISIFLGNFTKEFDFPSKNWPFIATSGQIILFLFKSNLF